MDMGCKDPTEDMLSLGQSGPIKITDGQIH